ncbi:GNAT family N-acetyltransferase [Sphingobium sp. YG1]|uniref:GNAT family N-acetyltransferase n=1 Tax=Sphingobium sp. YG1 TaxID=2082188 RepID=UPI001E54BF88|nr:GNAT family N-acetyltransferase [Sphingobium sp. YG1]
MRTHDEPSEVGRDVVLAPLRAYNLSQADKQTALPLLVTLSDESGNEVGGLWGETAHDWLFVESVFVPEDFRSNGFGTALMLEAEREAKSRGCIGIWLDTYEFQAPAFYKKLGFEVFGTLENSSNELQRYFLKKRL